jgi:hypothetical protein
MELENAAGYVLLSNINAAAGNRHLCENVEWQSKEKGVKKQLGQTWIEVNNLLMSTHFFVVEDQDHPHMIEIHVQNCRDCQGSCMMWDLHTLYEIHSA